MYAAAIAQRFVVSHEAVQWHRRYRNATGVRTDPDSGRRRTMQLRYNSEYQERDQGELGSSARASKSLYTDSS